MFGMRRTPSSQRPRRGSLGHVETKAWRELLRHRSDPIVAAELVQFMDADPALRTAYAAIYMQAKVVLKTEAERSTRPAVVDGWMRRLVMRVRFLFWAGEATIEEAERKQWLRLYRAVGDPSAAEEILAYLNAQPARAQQMPGLCIAAKRTLRTAGVRIEPGFAGPLDAPATRAARQADAVRQTPALDPQSEWITPSPEFFHEEEALAGVPANGSAAARAA